MGIALCLICGCGLPVVDLLRVVFGLWIIVGVGMLAGLVWFCLVD